MPKYIIRILFGLIIVLSSFTVFAAPAQSNDVRIYTLNGGYIDINDGAMFSDTFLYPHTPVRLAAPCFLIKHANDWLLWDTGLGDKYLDHPAIIKPFGIKFTVSKSIIAQLKQLGLTPNDIHYVVLSHAHSDHTGNLNLFPHATLFLQRAEYNFIQQKPAPVTVDKDLLTIVSNMNKDLLDGDDDVFGDGTVVILSTPGHTPGHQSLLVKLPKAGVVVLSGDLYHSRKSYQLKQVPTFNTSRAETLASMSRMDGILKNTHGRLIIQHDMGDFEKLPKIPDYLD